VISFGTVSRGSAAERVERTVTCGIRWSLRYVGSHDTGRASFFASVQPSCTAHVSAPVASEAGEVVAWYQTGDLLQVPHELRCSVLTAAY